MAKTLTPAQAKYFGKGRAHPFTKKPSAMPTSRQEQVETPRQERTEPKAVAAKEPEPMPKGRRSMGQLAKQIFG